MTTITKLITKKISNYIFDTSLSENDFLAHFKKAKALFSKPKECEYDVIKSYCDEYVIATSGGVPRCVTRECLSYKEDGDFLIIIEKENRMHNSTFACQDNYQCVMHVKSFEFKVSPSTKVIFEHTISETDKITYSLFAYGDSGKEYLEKILNNN